MRSTAPDSGADEHGPPSTDNTPEERAGRAESASPTVLIVRGEIDISTGTRLRTALATSISDPAVDPVMLDLRSVTFMSSTGIAVLIDADAEAKQHGKSLHLLVGDNRAVRRPLRLSGVDRLLRIDTAE